ncbi:MAG: NAD(P)/FAD-dependent oxidoreductase [Acidobacteriota bacterium]|nr:NAD(P)/FAD-dependent oxidoreductase [Acidobacteriota bacterium]
MSESFDVVVIGAGPAGENVAGRCAEGGLTVAIVESELVGGECSYWGCMPSKALLRPGDVLAAARRVPGAAGSVTGGADPLATFATRDSFAGHWDDQGQVPWLVERGIELVRGTGRLAGESAVVVAQRDGTTRHLVATTAVVIATGTRAARPPIAGLAEAGPWDNRDITATSKVPGRLLVIGGGVIGCEMAQAFRRLGTSEVTIVEAMDRLLGAEEPFVGEELRQAFTAEGIRVITGARVARVERRPDGSVVAELGDPGEVTADEVLVATGRRPATENLGLELFGIEPGGPIAVDDRLRATAVPGGWLYAVGDCNGRSLLTHMGKYQARVCGEVILGRDVTDLADGLAVPRVTFTDPQVSAVGLTEAQARQSGRRVRAVSFPTGHVAGSAVLGEGAVGTSKIVVDEDTHVIVGATFTGTNVQELLHSATVAIVGQVPIERLWHAVPSFPTVSEVWLRLMEAYER